MIKTNIKFKKAKIFNLIETFPDIKFEVLDSFMKKSLRTFENFLNERKQVGILYHFTNFSFLPKILESNSLKSNYPYISFTRNKNYCPECQVRILIDGDKLSDKYKIEPYSFTEGKFKDPPHNIPHYKYEAEERIVFRPDLPDWSHSSLVSELKNIKKYIIRIDVLYFANDRSNIFLEKMIEENPDINFRKIIVDIIYR